MNAVWKHTPSPPKKHQEVYYIYSRVESLLSKVEYKDFLGIWQQVRPFLSREEEESDNCKGNENKQIRNKNKQIRKYQMKVMFEELGHVVPLSW